MQLTIDQTRLLTHLPQFFQSLSSAVSEVLQNSTRAGAAAVDITLTRPSPDDAWQLTIIDNGPGVVDPADLFTAARTGWDETQVIEPAGLGFFALLGLSRRLTVTSRLPDGSGWTTTVNEDVFTGTDFPLTPLPVVAEPSGLRLSAVLKPEADVRPIQQADPTDLRSWRHAFPPTVTLHRPDARGVMTTTVLPSVLDPLTFFDRLDTSVGSLYGSPQGVFQPIAHRGLGTPAYYGVIS